ncbi:dynamin family protein [Turicibacter sanguinis]|uniref:dynamin family protein n=1 Tax=Turicibacter sanguinis TaxID=154288 RepID=UPI00189E0C55|nr:dynamin family protein [Turicibacter sanguinis]
MKKIFIKYNPYKLETEMTVDGEELAQNSQLRDKVMPGIRLQEWIEDLPSILAEEYACREWEITFHGTLLDFQDLTEVFDSYNKQGQLTLKINHIPVKETSDKIGLIDQVFSEIQSGPFDELKDEQIQKAFNQAKSDEFEVCVVATMSAGKSTLINAMLGANLMPSSCEACTAIITRIKDNDDQSWKAKVYGNNHRLLETHEELTYEKMVRLNGEKEVSVIEATGDIPFVNSENNSLVLIDTPGPNNSRDPEHKKVQSQFLSKSSKSLVLYIMEGTFGSDDDHQLLERVANSMAVAGKQSKDRFIFVVNKMDNRKKEDGSTEGILNRICQYLQSHGINNPNLFPVAALPALNIRLMASGAEIDDDTQDYIEFIVKKLNRSKDFNLEAYATLPSSIKEEINRQLTAAEETKAVNDQALIHTGIISVEAAIRQYVEKYAETAKIKNIVDTFIHKLDEVGCFEETKRKLSENRDQNEKIVAQIKAISQKVDDVKSAKDFKIAVNTTVVQVDKQSRQVSEDIIQTFQTYLTKQLDEFRGKDIPVEDKDREEKKLKEMAQKLQPQFQVALDELIRENLIKTVDALLEAYKNKLTGLIEEIDSEVFSGITIDPLKLMGGSVISVSDDELNRIIRTKSVKDGEEWVENTDKKWYLPWTWFEEDGYYRTKFKDIRFVKGEDIAQLYFVQIEERLRINAEAAYKQAVKESKKIVELYNKEFRKLDEVLKRKLAELERFATEKEKAEQRIHECESKLAWLEQIKNKVESILEI